MIERFDFTGTQFGSAESVQEVFNAAYHATRSAWWHWPTFKAGRLALLWNRAPLRLRPRACVIRYDTGVAWAVMFGKHALTFSPYPLTEAS